MRARRVLALASGGGHWVQLLRLAPAFDGHDLCFATVQADYRSQVPGRRFRVIRDATRWDRWGLLVVTMQLLWLMLRERPHVVVTTGAAPGVIGLYIAKKLFGARTIWIDSIANVEQMSMSGRHARRVADVWLSQWPEVAAAEGARYEGAVL